MPRALKIYLRTTCAYGLVHAIQWTWSRTTNLYNTHGRREFLHVDKLLLVGLNTVSAPFIWPLLLRADLIRLECLVRGKPVGEYLGPEHD